MFVLFLVVLLLVVGLGIDVGYAYVTEARLAKAVDAAALAGLRDLYLGQDQALAAATSMFAANFAGANPQSPGATPTITFTSSTDKRVIDVSAHATMNTLFVRILPQWQTMSVGASAEATRARLIMALVLDHSGSMGTPPPNGSGGGTTLAPSVSTFIDNFDDTLDTVAVSSFGSTATLNLSMSTPFKTQVKSVVQSMQFNGRTFSDGGLQLGLSQIENAPGVTDPSVIKVLVFFTDGFANTFQTTFSCSGQPLNLGQSDPFGNPVNGPWDFSFMDPNSGNTVTCDSSTFLSIDGTTKTISANNQNIWQEGQLRALNTANQIRTANITIFSIGLGSQLNQDFLKEIANDPSSTTFNPNQPAGEALFAPTPDDLQGVFQQLASKILLRLTK